MPNADKDIAPALQSADPQGRLDLLRRHDELIAGISFTSGNAIHILRDPQERIASMKVAIATARPRIDMESYIFDEGEGSDFADGLIAATNRGVEVSPLYMMPGVL